MEGYTKLLTVVTLEKGWVRGQMDLPFTYVLLSWTSVCFIMCTLDFKLKLILLTMGL